MLFGRPSKSLDSIGFGFKLNCLIQALGPETEIHLIGASVHLFLAMHPSVEEMFVVQCRFIQELLLAFLKHVCLTVAVVSWKDGEPSW